MLPLPTDTEALANRINFHTRDLHNKIDKRAAIKFAFVIRHKYIYIELLKTYLQIFNVIESNIDRILETSKGLEKGTEINDTLRCAEILDHFFIDEFRRKDPLIKDLNFLEVDTNMLLSEDYTNPIILQEFLDFIDRDIKENPLNVLAYCHVLYLALFAGGKIFKSNFYRKIGFLDNYKQDHMDHGDKIDKKKLVSNVTHFFEFADSVDEELKLKFSYKEKYDEATRNNLTEQEKLKVIETSRKIFEYNYRVIGEISDSNRAELMNLKSFRCLSFVLDEWRFNEAWKLKYFKIFGQLTVFILLAYIYIHFK